MVEENWEGEKLRVTAILWLVALIFIMVMFAVIYQNHLIMEMGPEDLGPAHESYMYVSSSYNDTINVTIYVLDGGEWDMIEFPLDHNTSENITIVWHGEKEQVIVVLYVEGDGCWRYLLEVNEWRIVMLV